MSVIPDQQLCQGLYLSGQTYLLTRQYCSLWGGQKQNEFKLCNVIFNLNEF